MHIELEINKESCIKCGRCAAVCPAGIFIQSEAREIPKVRNKSRCIVCGHCAAVCPSDSIEHSEFPPEKVHRVDKEILPSADAITLLLKKRRSRRIYKDIPVPEDSLELIVEAANTAPTAKNLQNLEYTLVTEQSKLDEIEKIVCDVFWEAGKKLKNPVLGFLVKRIAPDLYKMLPMLEGMKRSYDKGGKPILHGAKALLLVHAPKSSMFGCEDCNLACQNASLMAESLNVAQFYTGYVMRAMQMDKRKRIEKLLNIRGKTYAGMAFGIPAIDYPKYTDRRRVRVKKF